jgi:hypothetical protein
MKLLLVHYPGEIKIKMRFNPVKQLNKFASELKYVSELISSLSYSETSNYYLLDIFL